jgi:2-keto-4-pentenoate hydratase
MDDRIQRGLAGHLARFDEQLRTRAQRLGWKVAFNAPAIQKTLGIPYSLIAGLTRATLEQADAKHSLAGSTRVALEAEVAVGLRRDVDPKMSARDVAASIEWWAPAIEIVDFNRPFNELEAILSEGVFHRALRLGTRVLPTADADLTGITARVEADGVCLCDLDAREATGHAPDVLLHLARLIEPFSQKLAAGDVIILGSMNPLAWAKPDATFSLTLAGVGSVSVTTTA